MKYILIADDIYVIVNSWESRLIVVDIYITNNSLRNRLRADDILVHVISYNRPVAKIVQGMDSTDSKTWIQ